MLAERRASPRLEVPALTPAQQKVEELKAEIKARDGDPSAVDGWTAEMKDRERSGRQGKKWVFLDNDGRSFDGMSKALRHLGLRESKKPRLRVSTRVTQTIEEGRKAEQREPEPSCLALRGLGCKASCDCDFVAEDEDELTRHRMEVHGLSGDDAVQNPKWPCSYCCDALEVAKYDRSGELCPGCPYMQGGRRKPFRLERAEDKLRIAKWRREKGYVE